jgi:hypothetical protein
MTSVFACWWISHYACCILITLFCAMYSRCMATLAVWWLCLNAHPPPVCAWPHQVPTSVPMSPRHSPSRPGVGPAGDSDTSDTDASVVSTRAISGTAAFRKSRALAMGAGSSTTAGAPPASSHFVRVVSHCLARLSPIICQGACRLCAGCLRCVLVCVCAFPSALLARGCEPSGAIDRVACMSLRGCFCEAAPPYVLSSGDDVVDCVPCCPAPGAVPPTPFQHVTRSPPPPHVSWHIIA